MIKRLFDILFAASLLTLFLPLGLPLALLLRLTGEGKIFYRQPRMGRGGRTFRLFKFATMLENSPNIGTGDITTKNDPRVLPVGRVLRKTKLNEVPQILNILFGDMSVVGWRPVTPKHFAMYPEEIQRELWKIRPGLTGVGSIVFRDEERIIAASGLEPQECYQKIIAPYKGRLEMYYLERRSFSLDMLLVFLTAWAVLFPKSRAHLKLLKDLPHDDAVSCRTAA